VANKDGLLRSLLRLVIRREPDAAIRELSEGCVEEGSLYAVAIDLQSLKERLVQRTPTSLVGADVEVVTGGKEAKRNLEPFLKERMVNAGELDQSLRIALFNRQGVLPAFPTPSRVLKTRAAQRN
jgi:hypothetical protein